VSPHRAKRPWDGQVENTFQEEGESSGQNEVLQNNPLAPGSLRNGRHNPMYQVYYSSIHQGYKSHDVLTDEATTQIQAINSRKVLLSLPQRKKEYLLFPQKREDSLAKPFLYKKKTSCPQVILSSFSN
jgi:hypothetical protein